MQDLKAPDGQYTVWHYDKEAKVYLWQGDYLSLARAMVAALDHNSWPGQPHRAMVANSEGRLIDVYPPTKFLEGP